MGYGSYSHTAHEALLTGRASLPAQEVFQQRACHPLMNPKGVRSREACDSETHPNSLGIVFALDVTGSMGEIPKRLATRELPSFMKLLTDCRVADPQLLFMAVGDATSDQAPLQVGQFESTGELMDQWLTWSFLEGQGGAFGHESYELAMYFLAEHTDMDCFEKRKTKGYMFMTGDEQPYPSVSRHQVDGIIGDRLDEDIPTEAVVAALFETYHPFFLIPDLGRRQAGEARWRELLGDHVICMEDPGDTCYVAASLVALTEGVVPDVPQMAQVLKAAGASKDRVGAVIRAITPYAAALGKAPGDAPPMGDAGLPAAGGKSLWKRLTGR
jgi:hypothetical protein